MAKIQTKREIMAAIAAAAGITKKQAVTAYDELLKIAAKKVVKFRVAKAAKDAVLA